MLFMHTVRVITAPHTGYSKLYALPGAVLCNGLVSIGRTGRLEVTLCIKKVTRTATTLIPTNGG